MTAPSNPAGPAGRPESTAAESIVFAPDQRRGFLIKALAVITGGLALAVPLAAGVAFFFDPLSRKRRRAGAKNARRDAAGFLRIDTTLKSLPDDGRPQTFTVYDSLVDAWNKTVNQPIGRIFLRKKPDGTVVAFNVRCPHLGCAIDFRPAELDFYCPCHTSAFDLEGVKKNEIPPRGMDGLEVKIKNGGEVWVRYKMYKAGTPERIEA
jgi:menaquinol-cytochrome c reductase iron-sulfur subunit